MSRFVPLGLALAILLGLSAAPSQAQDYLQTTQIPVVVKPGFRLTVKVEFSAGNENALMIWRQNGSVRKVFNSIFGSRNPDEAPAGGGEFTIDVATDTAIVFLTGQHKDTGREGGGGRPWRPSRFKVFYQNESGAVVGFDDSDQDGDYNDITVTISLKKVNPSE